MKTRFLGLSVLMALLAACGGGSAPESGMTSSGSTGTSGQSCTPSSCGSAFVTVTDANGDFTSYMLDVKSVTLKRADGTVVETLPSVQRVDFAQLVDVSELLTALAVPPGDYVSGSITVDYTNAAVAVEVNGQSQTATVVDANGAALGVVQLDVQLDSRNHLVITPGRVASLALDFNLAASNTVDLTQTPVKVTAKPFVVASIVPAETKELRVRGGLASVSAGSSSYVVDVRPFREATATLGQVTVHTTAQTVFEINGTSTTGSAGLTALAAVPTGTIAAAFGTLQTTDQTFTAARVLVGTSLVNPSVDGLVGNVTARTGNTFTVRGATLERRQGDDRFIPGDVTVTVGSATVVTRADATPGLTTQAISVGQRVTVLGTASTDSTGKTSVDATQGRVRLEFTRLWGLALGSGAGTTSINLQDIDGRAASAFNFAGTGPSPAQNADPANYEVNTRTLPVNTLATGTATRFIGFVTPFGAAPPDFNAQTLVDFSNTASDLAINWRADGTATPFVSLAAAGIVVDMGNSALGLLHLVHTGPQVIDLKTAAVNPTLVPDATVTDVFAIRTDARQIKTFSSFADFVTDLSARLTAGAKVEGVWARGHYNATTSTFTASQLAVELN
jgi:hypothetical protein